MAWLKRILEIGRTAMTKEELGGCDMQIVKLYRKPDKPEFMKLIRLGEWGMLVNYPIDKPDRKREARWIAPSDVYIDWIKTFKGE